MSTFLVADDSASKAQYLMRLVDRSGVDLHLLGAQTTGEAKSLIDETNDIMGAFIDYEIPGENGPAIISHLRNKFPDAKIACVTGSASDAYRSSALESGADAFVSTARQSDMVERQITDLLAEWQAEWNA